MNANQLINMVIRMVTRRLLRTGMTAVSNRMGKGKSSDGPGQNPESAETVKRAKQTMRAARRIGRM